MPLGISIPLGKDLLEVRSGSIASTECTSDVLDLDKINLSIQGCGIGNSYQLSFLINCSMEIFLIFATLISLPELTFLIVRVKHILSFTSLTA